MSETNDGVAATPKEGGEEVTVEELQEKVDELTKQNNETVGNLKRELKDAKKALDDAKTALNPEPPKEEKTESNEPDYGKIALLNSKEVSHPDDQKIVMEEAERLKLPITDVLEMDHIKTKLETSKQTRVSQEALPKGDGRKNSATRDEVEFYLQNPDEKLPDDLDLANKIIDAKMNKSKNAGKFSDELYVG